MFDWFATQTDDAISMLKRDHDTVKALFDDFEDAEGSAAKRKIIRRALQELQVHAALEEEIFYPAVRKHVGKEIMNEAAEEHHVAKVLIAELNAMDENDEFFEPKFTVLAENVRHHIKEEEGEMLPKVQSLSMDFVELGQKMQARREQFLENGVPPVSEDKMVAASKRRGDSPAAAAKKKPVARTTGSAAKRKTTKPRTHAAN